MVRSTLLYASVALLAALIALWTLLTPSAAWINSVYSSYVYRHVAAALVPISDAVPFSLTGLTFVLLSIGVPVLLVRSWQRRTRTRRGLRRFALMWCWRGAAASLVVYALFLATWGANYSRSPLETRLLLETTPATTEEMTALTLSLAQIVHDNAYAAHNHDLAASLRAAQTSLRKVVYSFEGQAATLPSRVKATPPGLLILGGQATGVISPFWLEAHVDGALPDYNFLAVGLHELAHVAGYSSEAETDFVAAVAGLQADDPYVRYSMALSLFARFAWRLPGDVYGTAYDLLPQVAIDDLAKRQAVRLKYRPPKPVKRVQTKVYDSYLRTQGVSAGIQDYGRVANYLASAQRGGLLELPHIVSIEVSAELE